jgi:transposase InsO family protein
MGWALSEEPNAKLAKSALQQTINKHNPDIRQLMFHSDQEESIFSPPVS